MDQFVNSIFTAENILLFSTLAAVSTLFIFILNISFKFIYAILAFIRNFCDSISKKIETVNFNKKKLAVVIICISIILTTINNFAEIEFINNIKDKII